MTQYDLGQVVGADGSDGEDGVGIASITKTGSSGLVDTYTITYTDNTTSTFTVTNGAKGDTGSTGATGKGITSITKTGTSGLVDTYTITYSDSTTSTFTVTNGSDATVTIQTAWGSTTSDSKVPSEKLVKTNLDTKISKSSTSGLVKNDGSIDTSAYITNSALSNYIQKSSTTGLLKNDGTVMTSGTGSTNYSAGNHTHSGYVSATKVTSWSSTVSDSNVPSEKLVKDTIDALEDLIGDAIDYINL